MDKVAHAKEKEYKYGKDSPKYKALLVLSLSSCKWYELSQELLVQMGRSRREAGISIVNSNSKRSLCRYMEICGGQSLKTFFFNYKKLKLPEGQAKKKYRHAKKCVENKSTNSV